MTLLGRAFHEHANQSRHIPGNSFPISLTFCRLRHLVGANYHLLKRGLSRLFRRRSAQACAQGNPEHYTEARGGYYASGMHLMRNKSSDRITASE